MNNVIRTIDRETEALLSGAMPDHSLAKDVFIILMNTGLRPGELARLRRRDVNFSKRQICIRNSKTGFPLTIPMANVVQEVLERRPAGRHVTSLVLGKRPLASLNRVRKIWRAVAIKLGIPPFNCPALRHTLALRLLDSGVEPVIVCRILGCSFRARFLGAWNPKP